VKFLKGFWLALLLSLIVGLVIGTLLRRKAEMPERYIGSAPLPLHVAAPITGVLETRENEEQIAETVEIA
jgi:hypothetical protein